MLLYNASRMQILTMQLYAESDAYLHECHFMQIREDSARSDGSLHVRAAVHLTMLTMTLYLANTAGWGEGGVAHDDTVPRNAMLLAMLHGERWHCIASRATITLSYNTTVTTQAMLLTNREIIL